MNFRALLRRFLYTQNTLRYRVEWRSLEAAWKRFGKVESLFDGGAGSGEFARKALKAGYCDRVTAHDFDPGNFAHLKGNLGRDSRAAVMQGAVLEVPLPYENFDLVQCTQLSEPLR
jgi:predicted RNA methylase